MTMWRRQLLPSTPVSYRAGRPQILSPPSVRTRRQHLLLRARAACPAAALPVPRAGELPASRPRRAPAPGPSHRAPPGPLPGLLPGPGAIGVPGGRGRPVGPRGVGTGTTGAAPSDSDSGGPSTVT